MAIPISWIISIVFSEKGLFLSLSTPKIKRYPPSNMGRGKRLIIPRFMLMNPIRYRRGINPCLASSPAILAIPIGPHSSLKESLPVKSSFNAWINSLHNLPVSSHSSKMPSKEGISLSQFWFRREFQSLLLPFPPQKYP